MLFFAFFGLGERLRVDQPRGDVVAYGYGPRRQVVERYAYAGPCRRQATWVGYGQGGVGPNVPILE